MDPKQYNVPLILKDRALASTAEGITISNPSLPDNPIIYANRGFEKITGYFVSDVLGNNCRFLQGPDTDPKTREIIHNAIAHEHPCIVEILNYRKDGSTFWNRLSINPVKDDEGRTTHFIGIQSDVTKRRLAEEKLAKANQQMKKDLETAASIQKTLLPSVLPELEQVRFAWRFYPCDELAGDILNIIQLDSTHVGLFVLDVCGHGVSAALLSFSLSNYLSDRPEDSALFVKKADDKHFCLASPNDVVQRLNRNFPFDPRTGQFFTILYGILDLEKLEFSYTSAGHPQPVLIRREKPPECLLADGLPVGVMEDFQYTQQIVQLQKKDRLYLYTDGIIETINPHEKLYGMERLSEVLNRSPQKSLDETLDAVIESIDQWACHGPVQDDRSLLALEIR